MDQATPNGAGRGLFAEEKKEPRSLPVLPLAIAGGVVLLAIAILVFFARGKNEKAVNQMLPLDPYAGSLSISNLQMSESSSLSGGKSTYVDGHLTNSGSKTVTGITVQVLFRNDMEMPPQIETLPIALIRSRDPYIDTEPVSSAPIPPGASADFRLIFEDIAANWNMQAPELRITRVATQ